MAACCPGESSVMVRDLKEKRFEIDSKKIELDFLQKQFLVECKRFTATTIEGRIRQAISENPGRVFELGEEGLRPVKQEVNQMLDTVSDLVETIVNQDAIWRHTCDTLSADNFPENQYRSDSPAGPEIIEKTIKKLLSPTGELLLAHGLDSDINWERQSESVAYRHCLHLSQEMADIMAQYNERFNELSLLVKAYETLSGQNSGNDALDLWDSL